MRVSREKGAGMRDQDPPSPPPPPSSSRLCFNTIHRRKKVQEAGRSSIRRQLFVWEQKVSFCATVVRLKKKSSELIMGWLWADFHHVIFPCEHERKWNRGNVGKTRRKRRSWARFASHRRETTYFKVIESNFWWYYLTNIFSFKVNNFITNHKLMSSRREVLLEQ